MSRRPRYRTAGFTLIEILIAFAILSLSLAVLFQAFSGGFLAIDRAGSVSRAILVARSTLERVGPEIPIVEGMQHGGESDVAWTVQVDRASTLGSDALRGASVALYEIRVTVQVAGAAPVTLTTLRLASASHGAP